MLPEEELDALQAYILVKFNEVGTSVHLDYHLSHTNNSFGFYLKKEDAQHTQMIQKLAGHDYIVYCLDVPLDKIRGSNV